MEHLIDAIANAPYIKPASVILLFLVVAFVSSLFTSIWISSRPRREARKNIERMKDAMHKALQFGFVGEQCPDCQSFKSIPNGSCLKCTDCGHTWGCK